MRRTGSGGIRIRSRSTGNGRSWRWRVRECSVPFRPFCRFFGAVMNGAGQAIIDVDVDVDEGRPSHRHLPLAVRGEVGWRGPQVIAFFGFKVVVTMT